VERELAWSVGRKAPSVTGIDLEGRRISTDRYRGQVLLMDLWSRWSHDSLDLRTLYQRYHGRGLAILGVALDVDEAALRRFVREQNLVWPQLHDGHEWRSKIAGQFGYRHAVTALPRTILVDQRGVVRAVDLHGSALRKAVARLMDEEVLAAVRPVRR
jgi:peroxiredoxin